MLHAGFVRSPHAHARILGIDLAEARSLPGVAAAYAAADLPELSRPTPAAQMPRDLKSHGIFPLAPDMVRHVGEPVAVVLAESRQMVEDALDAVWVEYEPLKAALDLERALE